MSKAEKAYQCPVGCARVLRAARSARTRAHQRLLGQHLNPPPRGPHARGLNLYGEEAHSRREASIPVVNQALNSEGLTRLRPSRSPKKRW
jgi:hypothetical protein